MRPSRLVLPGLLLTLLLTGCGGASDGAAATAAPSTPSATTSTTAPPTPTPEPAPEPAPGTPVTIEQDCPYLDTATVQDTVGQRTSRVQTTGVPGGPPPSCTFLRPDGDPSLTVEVTLTADPVAAQTAAVDRVAGIGGTAVTDVADGGGIASVDGGTVLAVADGDLLVVVTLNQESSLQAREIAWAVTAAL